MYLASRCFDARAPLFGIAAAYLTRERGARGHAAAGCDGGRVNQRLKTRQRVGAVEFLRAMLLCLDDDDTVLRNAVIEPGEQARFHFVGQRRAHDVKTQMDGTGDFVDVLAASALRAHGGEFDVFGGDKNATVHGLKDNVRDATPTSDTQTAMRQRRR